MSDSNTARAFWVREPFAGELRREVLPDVQPGQARVRSLVSGLSRGTETLVFAGAVPASQHALMRCPHQEGEFPGPVKYGYCSVGRVEAGPSEWMGRRVFCLYPHQDRYVVSIDALVPIPDGVPSERAVLAANLETAINGLWDAAPRIGDRVAVVGAGVVGSLCAALLARMPGVSVELIDIDPRRGPLATALGCAFRCRRRQRQRPIWWCTRVATRADSPRRFGSPGLRRPCLNSAGMASAK